jgi:hypothetical protein
MDELELQTKEALEGKEVTKNIFPFQVGLTIAALRCCAVFSLRSLHVATVNLLRDSGHAHVRAGRACLMTSRRACCSTPSTCFRTTRR